MASKVGRGEKDDEEEVQQVENESDVATFVAERNAGRSSGGDAAKEPSQQVGQSCDFHRWIMN